MSQTKPNKPNKPNKPDKRDKRNKRYIDITQNNYNAVTRTIEHLSYRIDSQNRKPSLRELITLEVLKQEAVEIESVLIL